MNAEPFLAAAGFGAARRIALPADASFRRYERLHGGPEPALLMLAPPPNEDLRPFIAIGAHLRAAGLSAPRVLAADPDAGLAIIEDFGPTTMAEALDGGADPAPLYAAAVAALARLHALPPPPGLPRLDAARMAMLAGATFLEWWWPAAMGAPAGEGVRAAYAAAMHAMLTPFAAHGFVHRDYFPANLMPLDRPGAAGMGILDFQDAEAGHPAYDLVSLLEDARRDVAPALRAEGVAQYLALRPDLDAPAFRAAMAVMAAQRHLRVACLWVRLARRDGKPGYLRHGPRCWALLDKALSHPATAPLRDFLDAHVPAARRANPPEGAP